MNAGGGFLAIFNDVPAVEEIDYLHWLTREHTEERLSVPGFLRVRVFRARGRETSRYFILYRLRDPGVIASEAYLARLNAPTEWSQLIMPILENFMRGGGRVVADVGQGEGGIILPLVCGRSDTGPLLASIDKIARMDGVASARFFEVNEMTTAIPTAEKATRARDSSFEALLVVEGLTGAALGSVRDALKTVVNLGHSQEYHQIFSLESAPGSSM